MWHNAIATRGTMQSQHVAQCNRNTWHNAIATRGTMQSQHVAQCNHNTWYNAIATRGTMQSQHVAQCNRRTSAPGTLDLLKLHDAPDRQDTNTPCSFIRSSLPFSIHRAWCLLLERQGHQAKGMVKRLIDRKDTHMNSDLERDGRFAYLACDRIIGVCR